MRVILIGAYLGNLPLAIQVPAGSRLTACEEGVVRICICNTTQTTSGDDHGERCMFWNFI